MLTACLYAKIEVVLWMNISSGIFIPCAHSLIRTRERER